VTDQDLDKAITKALKTFDGVDTLSAKQRDGIANFIPSEDVSAVLPTSITSQTFLATKKQTWDPVEM